MEFGECNVYRATYDLVVHNTTQVEDEPCEERLLVAHDLEEAYEMAREIRLELRPSAVHRDLVVRDLTLVHARVKVTKETSVVR